MDEAIVGSPFRKQTALTLDNINYPGVALVLGLILTALFLIHRSKRARARREALFPELKKKKK